MCLKKVIVEVQNAAQHAGRDPRRYSRVEGKFGRSQSNNIRRVARLSWNFFFSGSAKGLLSS